MVCGFQLRNLSCGVSCNQCMMKVLKKFEKGVNFEDHNGVKFVCEANSLFCTCDLPAKCFVSNSVQFNRHFGCWHCIQPGEDLRMEKGGMPMCFHSIGRTLQVLNVRKNQSEIMSWKLLIGFVMVISNILYMELKGLHGLLYVLKQGLAVINLPPFFFFWSFWQNPCIVLLFTLFQ